MSSDHESVVIIESWHEHLLHKIWKKKGKVRLLYCMSCDAYMSVIVLGELPEEGDPFYGLCDNCQMIKQNLKPETAPSDRGETYTR